MFGARDELGYCCFDLRETIGISEKCVILDFFRDPGMLVKRLNIDPGKRRDACTIERKPMR